MHKKSFILNKEDNSHHNCSLYSKLFVHTFGIKKIWKKMRWTILKFTLNIMTMTSKMSSLFCCWLFHKYKKLFKRKIFKIFKKIFFFSELSFNDFFYYRHFNSKEQQRKIWSMYNVHMYLHIIYTFTRH